ncbi:MAG: hypothetical protein DI535_06055 [Citrobacter freundii]|nr:MAG: hypothetical protein DI535_06055 [Citrobacter freundii]
MLLTRMIAAQSSGEVVAAELAFANTARTETMKKAFLQYMDSTAVVFENGSIHNGFAFWTNATETNGKLLWHPSFYGMASSNDMGFTTGPWEYRNTMSDSAIASGQYTTIWIRNRKGEWKFLVDLGVSYHGSLFADQSLSACPPLIPVAGKTDTDIFTIETRFIQAFAANRQEAIQHFLHPNSWLNTDRQQPLQSTNEILSILTSLPAETRFKPIAGGISSSNDLAYVYGDIEYGNKKENYLRVWGRSSEGWRVILQVIKR